MTTDLNDGRQVYRYRPEFGEMIGIEVDVTERGFVIWTAECGVPMTGDEAKEWLGHFVDTWSRLAEARRKTEE